jgi:prepilin-type N-terminal cleavage/methylation domain-containing protein
MPAKPPTADRRPPTGFTLVELLIVIGIIAILVGLLFPVVSSVRQRGFEASTNATIASLAQACERYANDFGGAYPGPLSNDFIENTAQPALFSHSNSANSTGFLNGSDTALAVNFQINTAPSRVTMSENLLLALGGGLTWDTGSAPNRAAFTPLRLGAGPSILNPLRPSNRPPYFSADSNVSTRSISAGRSGQFREQDEPTGRSYDTVIPEFVDGFTSPMPILYLRARQSVNPLPSASVSATENPVVTAFAMVGSGASARPAGFAPYDLSQVAPYVGQLFNGSTAAGGQDVGIGAGRDISKLRGTANRASATAPHGLRVVMAGGVTGATTIDVAVNNPIDAYAYLVDRGTLDPTTPANASTTNRAKNRSSFILISAGRDRIYGTEDDITNFGRVGQ